MIYMYPPLNEGEVTGEGGIKHVVYSQALEERHQLEGSLGRHEDGRCPSPHAIAHACNSTGVHPPPLWRGCV